MMKAKKTRWILVDVLKYDVRNNLGKIVLKAGTRNVKIAFRRGCFTYVNDDGIRVRVNKYKDSLGRIFNGY